MRACVTVVTQTPDDLGCPYPNPHVKVETVTDTDWVAETAEEIERRRAIEDQRDQVFSNAVVELMREKIEDEHGDGEREPWLAINGRMDRVVVRRLKLELDARPGVELWVRHYDNVASSGVTSSRLRGYLGTDYYVRRSLDTKRNTSDIYARRRLPDEPMLRADRIRLGDEWVTPDGAAEIVGVSTTYLREKWYDTPALPKHKYGRRVVVKRADAEAIRRARDLGRDVGNSGAGGAALSMPLTDEYEPEPLSRNYRDADEVDPW